MKQKTHSGAKKRFRVTGKGKIMRQHEGLRHNLEKKSSRKTRRLQRDVVVADSVLSRVKRMLGHGKS
jgi:large subunit ribosomal protein L35